MVAIGVFGLLGYNRLGVDQFPKMEFPVVSVDAALDGASPEGVEEDVTDVLEERFTTISGVRTIRSSSFQGAARIEIEFVLGTDVDVAVQDVRDEVAQAMETLPKEIQTPSVTRSNSSGRPVLYAPFFSDLTLVQLSEYVERVVKPQIDTIPGVAGAEIFGKRDRNIRIWVDSQELRSRGLAASDLIRALKREHVDLPAGFIEGPSVEWTVKTDAEFKTIAELEGMVVSYEGDAPIFLRDVARVEDGSEDIRSMVHFHGKNSVAIGIIKQSDANTVAVANEAFRRLELIRERLPKGIELADREDYIDFSSPIVESVEESQFALLFGGFLAVFVVFIFLRRVRPTLIIALAIPLSLVSTFGLIWVADYTLNTMTLLGLTLAIGVVIDDAIIVLENIERHREGGKPARQAAQDGTREITFAATRRHVLRRSRFHPDDLCGRHRRRVPLRVRHDRRGLGDPLALRRSHPHPHAGRAYAPAETPETRRLLRETRKGFSVPRRALSPSPRMVHRFPSRTNAHPRRSGRQFAARRHQQPIHRH